MGCGATKPERCNLPDKFKENPLDREALDKVTGRLELDDLEFGVTLGQGGYGRVDLVTLKEDKETAFALKMQRKGDIMKHDCFPRVLRERKLLVACNHPFCIKLIASWQDNDMLYMLFPIAIGGEMKNLLKTKTKLPENEAQFYAAEVAAALMYLHSNNVVYRDVKAANVMLDARGHVRMVDFGFAKAIFGPTESVLGSVLYMAPEIIQRVGYGFGVDWWALGVLVFLMLSGDFPFYGKTNDEVLWAIQRNPIEYPASITGAAKKLCSGLMTRKTTGRLGAAGQPTDTTKEWQVAAHPWFAHINWTDLVEMKIEPPMKPELKNATDTNMFVDYPAKSTKSSVQLSHMQQQKFKDWDEIFPPF